jgi:cytochrome c556
MSKNRHPLTVALTLAAIIAPAGALVADTSAQELMKARHDHYHHLGDAFKAIRDQTRGATPDWATIKTAAKTVNDSSIDQSKWFSAGTGPEAGKTRALPEIWSRPQDFAAAQKLFSNAAPKLLAAANAGNIDGVKSQFGEVGKSCKNCHDTFRSPEDHD